MTKPTVSIAIPAYNEAENIGSLLADLFDQSVHSLTLTRVCVYTDGSTDATESVVVKLQKDYPLLQLKKGKENKGKLYRLNEIFTDNDTDILVVIDADLGIVGNQFLEHLIAPLLSSDGVQMVAAYASALTPPTVIGKIVSSSFLTWDYVRLHIPQGDSVHNLSSQATAYRGTFVKKLHIPHGATEERIYLYLMAKKENAHGFVHALSAQVKFWPIMTVADFIKLTKRSFGRKQEVLDSLFGFDTESILIVPKKVKIQGILDALVHHPLRTPIGLCLNILLPQLVRWRKTPDNPVWERATSTKRKVRI